MENYNRSSLAGCCSRLSVFDFQDFTWIAFVLTTTTTKIPVTFVRFIFYLFFGKGPFVIKFGSDFNIRACWGGGLDGRACDVFFQVAITNL